MEKVNGIGGVFIRANDPTALAAWYRDTLGINLPQPIWTRRRGFARGGDTLRALRG